MSVLLPGVLVVFAAFGMKWADTYIYNQDAGYKYFREYGSARARVVDASDYGYEAYAEELEKIGVSENDYKLMRTWNFADDEVFSLEIMEKTAEIIANYKKNVELSKEALLENIQTRGLTGYPIGIASIILLILTIVFQRKNYGFSFVINGIGGLYILYFFMRERVVYRIEYAVFLGVFLGMLYFWENIGMKSDGISKENNVEIARICAIINLVCVIAEAPLFLPDRSYLDVASEGRKEYVDYTFFESWNYDARKYRKVVNKGIPENYLLEEIKKNKENFYFLDFQTTMQTLYYEWNPFFALRPGYFDNSLYFASVMTNFPETLDVFREYDIEQPLKSLIEENVYLVDQDSRTLRNKVQYLQEHGYPDARAELYKDISGYQIWKICEE